MSDDSTTFRDQVLAYLRRDEYPLLGATTDDLPDGVDVSVWDDEIGSIVLIKVIDPELTIHASEPLIGAVYDAVVSYENATSDGAYAFGVICVPPGDYRRAPFMPHIDELSLGLWTFDVEHGFERLPFGDEDDEDELS